MKFGINNPAWLQAAGNILYSSDMLMIKGVRLFDYDEDGNCFLLYITGSGEIRFTRNGEEITTQFSDVETEPYFLNCDEGSDIYVNGDITSIITDEEVAAIMDNATSAKLTIPENCFISGSIFGLLGSEKVSIKSYGKTDAIGSFSVCSYADTDIQHSAIPLSVSFIGEFEREHRLGTFTSSFSETFEMLFIYCPNDFINAVLSNLHAKSNITIESLDPYTPLLLQGAFGDNKGASIEISGYYDMPAIGSDFFPSVSSISIAPVSGLPSIDFQGVLGLEYIALGINPDIELQSLSTEGTKIKDIKLLFGGLSGRNIALKELNINSDVAVTQLVIDISNVVVNLNRITVGITSEDVANNIVRLITSGEVDGELVLSNRNTSSYNQLMADSATSKGWNVTYED